MKNIFLLIFYLSPLISVAQSNFTINGTGMLLKDGDQIFLQYRSPDGIVIDSVLVSNQKFHFKGKVNTPIRANLYRNQNPKYADLMFDYAIVYLEKGNILLKSADTLLNAISSGTPLNSDYSALAADLKPYNQVGKTLRDPADLTAEERKDSAFVAATNAKMNSHITSMIPVKLAFVKNHPSSFVSLITVLDLIKDSKNVGQVEQCYTLLNPELKSSAAGKLLESKIISGNKIMVGRPSKDFGMPDSNGNLIHLFDYKGEYVLLDFWASWCMPCRAENPNLVKAYKQYKNKGLIIISISIDEAKDKAAWLKAIKEDGLVWPQLSDLKGNRNIAAKIYGITTIPSNVLISPEGIVIAKDIKREELQSTLALIF